MASGFHYSCSQFLSALQFPSLSSQVHEVARQLKDPSNNSLQDITSVSESTSSSRPSPHVLKLFLSGCECDEAGAVEASCWGLRRLHESDLIDAHELVEQLQTKLTTCLHSTPLVSLLADLLLAGDSHSQYNLHSNQHPLVLVFSPCPDAVTCVISSLLTSQSAPGALRMLWPCLLHLLIYPQLTHCRMSLTYTLLEVASVSSAPDYVACSLLRLLLLAVVYSSDNTNSFLLILLDFSLSHPNLTPLTDVISLSCNVLLHCSVHTVCSLLLHKLKRLFILHHYLLSHFTTLPWLALSLLNPFLTHLTPLIADIAQLLVEHTSSSTQDSLSLLILPLLSAQLSLHRIRPDISSRYSFLLQSLLTAQRRSQRSSGTLGQAAERSLLEQIGIDLGELSLFASLSHSLFQCHTCLIIAWCQDAILLLSRLTPQSHSLVFLSCLACSLLIEFTSPCTTPSTDTTRIIQLLLRLVALLVSITPSLSPPLIACLMLAMDRCPYPEETALTLRTISSLSTHPACVLVLLRSLLSLSDTSSLLPLLLRALVSLWKQHDAVFPHLKQLIQLHTPFSPDWTLARSLSVLDVCQERAVVHGEEMLPLVTDLIKSRDSLFICIGFSALVCLVEAGVVEYNNSLDLLSASVGLQSPFRWESAQALSACRLLRLSFTQLEYPRDQELQCRCLQQLMALLTHSEERVRAAAVSSLSETTPRELILLEPFSHHLRSLLSLPDCLDLSPDKRHRSQCASLFSLILGIEFSPRSVCEGRSSFSQFLSRWLDDELDACSHVFPREHRQEAERGEAALRSTAKLLASTLPKLNHQTELSESYSLPAHHAVSVLFLGRELWEHSEEPEKMSQQYLRLLAHSLYFPLTPDTAIQSPSDVNSFIVFIHGVQLFMRDVILSTSVASPLEFLFSLLDRITCSRNPQGAMWLMVGLALNVRELHSSSLQSAIQTLINSLISGSTHIISPTDSYVYDSTAPTMSFSQDSSAISGVSYLGLGMLGGVMTAFLKQNFSTNTLSLYIRTWNISQPPSHQLDTLYALTLSSILLTRDVHMSQEGPSTRKLSELSKRCTEQIQKARYPSQFAYLLLIDDVALIQSVQQDSLQALTAEAPTQPLEIAAMNCSLLTCRLYSLREISLPQCDEIVVTFLKLSTQAPPNSCLHSAAGILLFHTACAGHVASQLLIDKSLTQFKSLLQQAPDQIAVIFPLLNGIFALFGAFQPVLDSTDLYPCPPTPTHYSLLQQGVRTLLDHIAPKIDKNNHFSQSFHLLGYIYRQYSLFSATIRTPSSSNHLPDNTILTPLFSFIEQSLHSGTIYRDVLKFQTIFEVLSSVRNPLPSYPWTNLITCFQRSSEHDGVLSSLLRLLFKLQTQATEQEHLQIGYLLHEWIYHPRISHDRLRSKSKCIKVIVDNLSSLFNSVADHSAFKRFLLSLLQDSSLFLNILKSIIKMLAEQDIEGVKVFKITLLTTSLEIILNPPFSSYSHGQEFISLIDKCLSKLTSNNRERLVTQEEPFLSLRVYLFNYSHEFFWLRPCIPYLLDQHTLVCVPPSHLHDIIVQFSLIRTLPCDSVSQVCLEVLNIAKSTLQKHSTSASLELTENYSTLVFNTMYLLSLINSEISRLSGMLSLNYQLLLPDNSPLDSHLYFYFSNVTFVTIMLSTSRNKTSEIHTSIMKNLYELLILFSQFLDNYDHCDSILITSIFSFLARIRQIDDIIASKPWALFGQIVFIQSKLLLK